MLRNLIVVGEGIANFSTHVNALVLTAGVPSTATVPAGAAYVSFSANCDIYVRWIGTAAVPAANVSDGTGSELNPTSRYIPDIMSFSVASPTGGVLTLQYWS
jgi:hypothetical protein